MALPIRRPEPTPGETPQPTQPEADMSTGGLPKHPPVLHQPTEHTGIDLDEGTELSLPSRYNLRDERLNIEDYGTLSSLTSADVIDKDYETYYARFEEKIVIVKTWLQEILSEEGKSVDVAEARKDRKSKKFKDMKDFLDQTLIRYISQNPIVSPKDAPTLIAMVINEILGLGPIEPLWQDSRITEIMVNGPFKTRIEVDGKLITAKGVRFRDAEHLLETCQQILAPLNKTIDTAHSFEDGRLTDGSRINVTHPVIGPGGPYLTIRRFPDTVFSMRTLVDFNALTEDMAAELAWLVNSAVSGLISGGTGSGKALTLDTKIPLATGGMTTMGEIKVGDMVLGPDGKPTKVLGYFPQPRKEHNYEVVFSDGTRIVTDADHLWETTTNTGDNVVSTLQIRDTLLTLAGNFNHSIRLTQPVEYPEKAFSLTPYELVDEIPDEYLYGSVAQRKELLSGFLDRSNATVTPDGGINITHGDITLLANLQQVMHSLGYFTGRIHQKEGEGSFYSYPNENLFTSGSRRDDFKLLQAKRKTFVRYIVEVNEVPWSPTACITVDNEDHLYLCSEAYVPTHNTSFLNALSGCIPENERIITIEDNLELRLHPKQDVIALEARKSHQGDGKGNVTIRDLVRNSLRMRPDRIVIGEIRDATALDLLNAANTGHDGSLTTLHSNSVEGAIDRVVNLVLESGESEAVQALSLLANGFDFIIQISRYEDGSRRVAEIAEIPQRLEVDAGVTALKPVTIWKFVQDGTDENHKLFGHYERVNEWSEALINKHRLNNRPKLTIEQVYELSDQPEELRRTKP